MACSWLQKILLSLLLTAVVVLCQRRRDSSSYNPCVCPGRSDSDKVCRCVYITRCNKTGYVLTNTIGVQSRAGGGPIACKAAEICCIVPETPTARSTETPTTTSTETPTSTSTETPTTTSTENPTTTSTELTTSTTLRVTEGTSGMPPTTVETRCGCGIRRPGQDNTVGDLSTSFGEFPWLVNILNITTKGPENKCGGSLISHSAVLTAAHCVYGLSLNEVGVKAGDWDIGSEAEPLPSYDRYVTKIIIHKGFNIDSLENDIALLIVEKPLPRQPHIDTICLPEQGATFDGKRCTVAGWGARKSGNEVLNTKPTKFDVPVIAKIRCRDMLRETYFGRYFELDKSFMCAGGEETGTCAGDGGSPLMCESDSDPGRYYLAGIVAGGLGCGEKDTPDLYADVGQYKNWINTQLNVNSI